MHKILEIIYSDYTEKPLSDNLLETPEISKAFNSFFNAHFDYFSYDKYNKAYCRLLNIISAYQKKAFETGFYTGMELISRYCIELIKLLQSEKKAEQVRIGTAWKDNNWFFTQWNGEIMNPQTPSKQFSKFLVKNGIKHRKFHALRHTSATLLLYGDVNLKEVQSRLGHADISTTNKYLHSIAEADEAAADVLQNMLTENKTITLKPTTKVE